MQNRLLAALPRTVRDRLLPSLDTVPLILKDFLYRPGERVEYVYFPGSGFCSIVTVLENGSMVEVATIGREGMVGMPAALDGHPVASATMVQGAADTCYRMTAAAFRHEMDWHGPFFELLMHFSKALMGFVMQSTACNAVHSVEQRLARWLLMAQDRMGADEFPLTQEFVAMMLGASRPTVTVVAGTLRKPASSPIIAVKSRLWTARSSSPPHASVIGPRRICFLRSPPASLHVRPEILLSFATAGVVESDRRSRRECGIGRVRQMSEKRLVRLRGVRPLVAAVVQPVAKRLSRIEALLIEIRHEQDVQLRRVAKLQAQVEKLVEDAARAGRAGKTGKAVR